MKLFLIPALLVLSLNANAAPTAQDVQTTLRGTDWIGTFSTAMVSGKVHVHFLSTLSAKGDLQYKFRIDQNSITPLLRSFVSRIDAPCRFTPRTLKVEQPTSDTAPVRGQIAVYECEASAEAETKAAQDPARPVKRTIDLDSLQLSPNGELTLNATLDRFNLFHIQYVLTPAQP